MGLVGWIALRLRGFYLAVITLAVGLIAYQLFKNLDVLTGGVSGLGRIPAATLWGWPVGDARSYCYVVLFVLLAVLAIATGLTRSPAGRAMRAIAANELAARSVGIDTFVVKLVIFVLAASFTGLAGGLGLPVHRPHHALGDALTTAQAFIALATHLERYAPQTVHSLSSAKRRARTLAVYPAGAGDADPAPRGVRR